MARADGRLPNAVLGSLFRVHASDAADASIRRVFLSLAALCERESDLVDQSRKAINESHELIARANELLCLSCETLNCPATAPVTWQNSPQSAAARLCSVTLLPMTRRSSDT